MSIFYVSAHSKIPKLYREIDEVPLNTYIIMKTECGQYSWIDDTAFVEKYLTTLEGVRSLRDFVTTTDHLEIDGKRIFRPGEVGPVDQKLSFRQNPSERIFLGVNIAPVNVKKIQNLVYHLDRNFLENFYIDFHVVFKGLYDNGVTGFAEDPASFKDKNELVFNLMDMMSTYAGSINTMSYQQFERLLTDKSYFTNFVNRRVNVNSAAPADIQISELVREQGAGIYVIDTCRAHRKVTIHKDVVHVAPSRKKGFKGLQVRMGSVKKMLSGMKPETRQKYEPRITNAMRIIPELRRREQVRTELI